MTSIITALTDGARRVWRAPAILAGVYLLLLFTTTLPGLVVREDIALSLGQSADADAMVSGVNLEWWDRFGESASGLSRSFSPTIIGFGATLDNLSRLLDKGSVPVAVLALAGAYMLVWLLLAGGILDRFARNRATRGRAFFGACGMYFPRLLRLGILGLVGYWLLFAFVYHWLFGTLWDAATRDMSTERSAFLLNLVLYAVFGAMLLFWNVVLDYARIRAVVEDRYSMVGALLAGFRFAFDKPFAVAGLYLLNGLCFVIIVSVWSLVAPGAAGGGLQIWTAFAVAQVYIIVRLFAKLMFYASQTALFQQSLAHAAYTAPPPLTWPDSAAAESIVNAAGGRQ